MIEGRRLSKRSTLIIMKIVKLIIVILIGLTQSACLVSFGATNSPPIPGERRPLP
jgi:hypothetical protein